MHVVSGSRAVLHAVSLSCSIATLGLLIYCRAKAGKFLTGGIVAVCWVSLVDSLMLATLLDISDRILRSRGVKVLLPVLAPVLELFTMGFCIYGAINVGFPDTGAAGEEGPDYHYPGAPWNAYACGLIMCILVVHLVIGVFGCMDCCSGVHKERQQDLELRRVGRDPTAPSYHAQVSARQSAVSANSIPSRTQPQHINSPASSTKARLVPIARSVLRGISLCLSVAALSILVSNQLKSSQSLHIGFVAACWTIAYDIYQLGTLVAPRGRGKQQSLAGRIVEINLEIFTLVLCVVGIAIILTLTSIDLRRHHDEEAGNSLNRIVAFVLAGVAFVHCCILILACVDWYSHRHEPCPHAEERHTPDHQSWSEFLRGHENDDGVPPQYKMQDWPSRK